jgi:hypothetical protein
MELTEENFGAGDNEIENGRAEMLTTKIWSD